MIERGILFKGRLVRSILRGLKTQTRRIPNRLRVVPRATVRSDMPSVVLGIADPRVNEGIKDVAAVGDRRYWARINPQGAVSCDVDGTWLGLKPGEFDFVCPYADGRTYLDAGRWHIDVAPDQRLWVRETHAQFSVGNRTGTAPQCVAYRATCDEDGGFDYVNGDEIMRLQIARWTPGIHMPRWASRIDLAVAHVRLEPLQAITKEDAIAEGAHRFDAIPDPSPYGQGNRWSMFDPKSTAECLGSPQMAFANAWDAINGKRSVNGQPASWDSNPWVWAVTFAVVPRV